MVNTKSKRHNKEKEKEINKHKYNKDKEIEDIEIHGEYCKGYKWYPLIWEKQKRIIAIGDLHGDFNLLINALRLAKVIDNDNNWTGGETVVVQVGDQLDGCRADVRKNENCDDPDLENLSLYSDKFPIAEDVKIMEFLNDLNKQAIKAGGAIISLLGNHELMNVNGQMNYVSYNDIQKFKNYKDPNNENLKFDTPKDARIHAFKPGNEYAKLMACSRLPAVIIGSFVFVHAGFIHAFMEKLQIKKKDDLYKISVALRKWLLGLIDKDNVSNIINAPKEESMFWVRIINSLPKNRNNEHEEACEDIKKVLEIFDVKSMVIGHTPQFINNKGINSECSDQLWQIDFGGSFAFQKFDENNNFIDLRNVQVLEILNDKDIKVLKNK